MAALASFDLLWAAWSCHVPQGGDRAAIVFEEFGEEKAGVRTERQRSRLRAFPRQTTEGRLPREGCLRAAASPRVRQVQYLSGTGGGRHVDE